MRQRKSALCILILALGLALSTVSRTTKSRGFPVLPLSADEQAPSDAMVSYWTRFGKTGNHNSLSTPLWAPYNSSSDQFQSLIPPMPSVESTFDTEHLCSAFWNTF
jgi:carboxylesterase type B